MKKKVINIFDLNNEYTLSEQKKPQHSYVNEFFIVNCGISNLCDVLKSLHSNEVIEIDSDSKIVCRLRNLFSKPFYDIIIIFFLRPCAPDDCDDDDMNLNECAKSRTAFCRGGTIKKLNYC